MKVKSFLCCLGFTFLFVFLSYCGSCFAADVNVLTYTHPNGNRIIVTAPEEDLSDNASAWSYSFGSWAGLPSSIHLQKPVVYRQPYESGYYRYWVFVRRLSATNYFNDKEYHDIVWDYDLPIFSDYNAAVNYSNGLPFDDSTLVGGSIPEFVDQGNQDYRPKIKTADFLYQVNLSGSIDCKLGVNFENIDVPLPTRTCVEFYLELPSLSSVQSFVDSNNVNINDDSAVILFLNNYMAENNNARWVNSFQYTSFVLKDELAGEAESYVLDLFSSDLRFSLLSQYPGSPNLYRIALAFAHPKSFSAYFKWKDGLAITAGGRDTYFFNQYGYNNALFRGTGGGSFPSDIEITNGKVDTITNDQFYELLLALLTQRNTDSSGNENYYYNYFNDYNNSVGDIWDKYFNGSNQDVDDAIGGIHSVLMSVRNIPLLFGTAFNHFFPKQVIDLMTFVLVLIVVLIILCIVRRFI